MSKETPPLQPPTIELDTSTPMERFLEANIKKLVILFVLIAVGAVAYGVMRMAARSKAVAAGEAFAAAKTVEDCDLVVSEYPGSTSAGNALLLKADLLWTQNKKDSSVAALREFTTKFGSHPLLAEGLLALASKLEATGDKAGAKAAFDRILSEFPKSDSAAVAQLRIGDQLWAEGKEAEAKAAYEAVSTKGDGADSAFADQSESRLKWIAAQLPTKEVDGPPKPKVDPAAAIPGAPKFNLGSPLSPVPGLPEGAAPQIQVTPGAAMPAPQIQVTPAPAPAAPAPKVEVTPVPAPAPASTPAVPAPAPQVEVKPVPAPTPVPAPAAPVPAAPVPEAPKIEVKPAPAAPVPTPPPAPAPVPAPAQPEAPAPAAPAKAS
ncbi:MAG TPA: tetratricopeptide repeat protein [Prosthecobacter sp.]